MSSFLIKKSDIQFLKKSNTDKKFDYFKQELLEILDKKEKEEASEEISKAFIVDDLYKSMTDPFYMAKGGKVGTVGEVRTWNGKKYKKMPNKKWVRVYDKETRGAKIAIAFLRKKIDTCTNSQELLNVVLENKERFCDELGRPLPIVQELSKYVSSKNDKLETQAKNIKNTNEPYKDGRFDFTQELKQKAVNALNNPTEKINYVDYTRENYNKLFPRGECQTPLGTVKLSPKQFERLETKDNGVRIKFMGALQQCLQRPDVIIGKTDNKDRYSKLYLKAFLDNSGKKSYLAVVPNIDDVDVVVSNSPRDTKDIANEIKKAGICYYIRPAVTSSTNSGGSRMENSSDGLTSNNSRNEEVKPSDSSNIPHNDIDVNKKKVKEYPDWVYPLTKERIERYEKFSEKADKMADYLNSVDASSITTIKQFKRFANYIQTLLPSMKVVKGDDGAEFAISFKASSEDDNKFQEKFMNIFDEKFEDDGWTSENGQKTYFYNPKEMQKSFAEQITQIRNAFCKRIGV